MNKCPHCQSNSFRKGSKAYTQICNQCNKEQGIPLSLKKANIKLKLEAIEFVKHLTEAGDLLESYKVEK